MSNDSPSVTRVMHVISGDLWAGAEAMAHTLLSELRRDPSLELQVVVLNHGILAEKLRDSNVPVTVIEEKRYSALAIFAKLRRLVADIQPHIIHTHRQKENVLGALAARTVGAKSLRTVHGWIEFPNLGLRLDKRLFRWLDLASGSYLQQRIVAVSDELALKLSRQFETLRIKVIENGVDLEAVRAQARLTNPGLLGSRDCHRVGVVARLVPVKRHDRFIEAANLLLENHPRKFEFFIVGGGPLADELAEQLRQSPYASRIHALGFRRDVLNIIVALDAIVVCSEHEGVPMSVLEGAALGIPIVTVPLSSIEAIIVSGARGTIADSSSPQALAQAISESVKKSKPNVRFLGDDWEYSSATMARRYKGLYDELATG